MDCNRRGSTDVDMLSSSTYLTLGYRICKRHAVLLPRYKATDLQNTMTALIWIPMMLDPSAGSLAERPYKCLGSFYGPHCLNPTLCRTLAGIRRRTTPREPLTNI